MSRSNKEISLLIMGGSQSAKIFGETLPLEIVKCSERELNSIFTNNV